MRKKLLSILALLCLTVTSAMALDFAGQGTQELPYLITSIEDWNNLAVVTGTGTWV